MKHTFVICAYGESEYLEECILSLKNQKSRSLIIMETSTPTGHISSLAEKYEIPLYINPHGGITRDWNFGLSKINTKYATVAHQDDVYEPEYGQKILETLEKSPKALIAFSDYGEIRAGHKVTDTRVLKIKRLMLLPLRIKVFRGCKAVRRLILSMGDPIGCPAVSFNLERVDRPVFKDTFRCCGDWEAWEALSKRAGDFLYVPEPLMYHRIHEESETTRLIHDHVRVEENYQMYRKFWPKSIAGRINRYYSKSEEYNTL